MPFTVDRISSDTIRNEARRTLPEALQYTPGVLVQKTSQGHGSPFIRGSTGRQNLLLVDGVRLNNSTWRSGPVQYWNTVDPYSLDSMELVKSQGSVMFGSDAIGGTLNAFTKSSNFQTEKEGDVFTHGSAFYQYRSNGGDSHIGRVEGSVGVGGQWGLHLGISGKDFGDIEDSAVGTMHGTGYEEQDYDLRFDIKVAQDTILTVESQYVNQDDISRWHRTLDNPGWVHDDHVATAGSWVANDYDQERSLTYLRVSYEIQKDWRAYGSVSQSFRTPNLADLTGNTASLSGLDGHGSPDVDPEKFLTCELGTRGTLREDLQIQAAIFYTTSTDGAITSYTSGRDIYVVNGEDSEIYGIEAETLWTISETWSLSAFAAWQEGKSDIDQRSPSERWIPRMLPFTGSAALRYTVPDGKWWVEGRLSGAVDPTAFTRSTKPATASGFPPMAPRVTWSPRSMPGGRPPTTSISRWAWRT